MDDPGNKVTDLQAHAVLAATTQFVGGAFYDMACSGRAPRNHDPMRLRETGIPDPGCARCKGTGRAFDGLLARALRCDCTLKPRAVLETRKGMENPNRA